VTDRRIDRRTDGRTIAVAAVVRNNLNKTEKADIANKSSQTQFANNSKKNAIQLITLEVSLTSVLRW